MNLEKILKDERIRQGMSQQTLAEIAGVTRRAIIYWESGEKSMSVDSADKVFKALRIAVTLGYQEGVCNDGKTEKGSE